MKFAFLVGFVFGWILVSDVALAEVDDSNMFRDNVRFIDAAITYCADLKEDKDPSLAGLCRHTSRFSVTESWVKMSHQEKAVEFMKASIAYCAYIYGSMKGNPYFDYCNTFNSQNALVNSPKRKVVGK